MEEMYTRIKSMIECYDRLAIDRDSQSMDGFDVRFSITQFALGTQLVLLLIEREVKLNAGQRNILAQLTQSLDLPTLTGIANDASQSQDLLTCLRQNVGILDQASDTIFGEVDKITHYELPSKE